MTEKHKDAKPWQPTIEREPEFNAFANPLDRKLENPMPLEESDSEGDEPTQTSGSAGGNDA